MGVSDARGPLTLVRWVDAAVQSGWKSPQGWCEWLAVNGALGEMVSVGWLLVTDQAECVTLAQSWGGDGDCGGVICIPRACIRAMRSLDQAAREALG